MFPGEWRCCGCSEGQSGSTREPRMRLSRLTWEFRSRASVTSSKDWIFSSILCRWTCGRMEVGRLLNTFLLGSIRLWGLSLNFTLEEMVHPYVMVNFCILITKRQALVLREEFPGTLRMVLLFRNLVEAVQLFILRSVLVVNLAVNRKAGDFLQVPQGFFLQI